MQRGLGRLHTTVLSGRLDVGYFAQTYKSASGLFRLMHPALNVIPLWGQGIDETSRTGLTAVWMPLWALS